MPPSSGQVMQQPKQFSKRGVLTTAGDGDGGAGGGCQGSRYIVCIAGPPGAGKSIVASVVAQRVTIHWSKKHENGSSLISTEEISTMLPMDGFHLYRSQLNAMEVYSLPYNPSI
ncbi:hypothetical protein GUJ93_ZPchr0012g21960 [Zizania palustris]|uniref:Uncharacterized protein n=1 Tax=Zizania palustris TaxID=103762 RepID=A0A8J5WXF2_ZIZPA|nr:hypothetical protein GUJ93_ZPchr0012g21960 [Zizania palustris]